MVVKSIEVDIGVKGDVESKAKLDAIDARAEALKRAFPTYTLKVDAAAAAARLTVFKGQLKSVTDAVGKPAEVQVLTAKATKALLGIQAKAEELRATFPEFTVQINDKVAKAELDLFAAEAKVKLDKIDKELAGAGSGGILSKIPGFGGGSGAAGGAAGGAGQAASAGIPLLGSLGSTGGIAAVGVALAALPFAAQAAAGGIVFALGGAMAAIGVYAASKSTEVKKQFASLKTEAVKDFGGIGTPFNNAVAGILKTAQATLPKVAKPFSDALKAIAGPFGQFGSALVKAFGTPAVATSLQAVGKAFAAILKAATPGLAGAIGNIASGVTKLAGAVAANPKAFTDFVGFLFATAGGVLTALAGLTRFASYVEKNFIPLFDLIRHDVAAYTSETVSNLIDAWNKVWTQTVGRAIQGGHDVEDAFNNLKQWIWNDFILKIKDFFTTTLPGYWDTTVNFVKTRLVTPFQNAVSGGVTTVVGFFTALPGKVTGALGSLGTALLNIGKGAMSSLLSGFTSVATSILGWLGNFAKSVLNAIGSVFGIHFSTPSVSTVFHQVGAQIMQGMINGIESKTNAAVAASKAAAKAVGGALGTGGVSNASGVAALKSAAAKHGWTSTAEWAALNNVEMREAGYSLTATNPSSGAYGMAQFINGPSEYAQYGGNSTTYAGQATAMANYIAQRYGDPIAAWAHEQQYGWYDQGGLLPKGLSLALNTSGRPEMVVPHGGGADAGAPDKLLSEMRRQNALLEQLIGVSAAAPARTGQHVAGAIGGAASAASFRARYPTSR